MSARFSQYLYLTRKCGDFPAWKRNVGGRPMILIQQVGKRIGKNGCEARNLDFRKCWRGSV